MMLNRFSDQVPPPGSSHAKATIRVHESHAEPFDETAAPPLAILAIRETFEGDIQGESTVRALQVGHEGGTVHMASLQRVTGSLSGHKGSFVLKGAETIENGAIKASWSVIPGSGTEDLAGLRGNGGFEGRFGEGSHGTLDYWFE